MHSTNAASLQLNIDTDEDDDNIETDNNNTDTNPNSNIPSPPPSLPPVAAPFSAALANEMATGQAALNRLLASLALETELIERCDSASATTDETSVSSGDGSDSQFKPSSGDNNGNIFTYPSVRNSPTASKHNSSLSSTASTTSTSTSEQSAAEQSAADSHLNDVLASLTDFTRSHHKQQQKNQLQLQLNNNHNNNINHSANGRTTYGRQHLAVKRLQPMPQMMPPTAGGGGGSESSDTANNSSSVSPSLSDRSNGLVSWSDQVECSMTESCRRTAVTIRNPQIPPTKMPPTPNNLHVDDRG